MKKLLLALFLATNVSHASLLLGLDGGGDRSVQQVTFDLDAASVSSSVNMDVFSGGTLLDNTITSNTPSLGSVSVTFTAIETVTDAASRDCLLGKAVSPLDRFCRSEKIRGDGQTFGF